MPANYVAEMNHLLSLFDYDHLPSHLQEVSKYFHDMAREMECKFHPEGLTEIHDGMEAYEFVQGLRKLLEAKDCMVRAKIAGMV